MENKNSALIIVDLQNDFISGSMAVPGAKNLADKINKYLENNRFNFIVTTQDWHNPNHPSFKKYGGIWPEHCIKDTWGAEITSELNIKIDKPFFKAQNEESFSGFYKRADWENGLKDYLNKNNVERVFVCGLAFDYCVIATAIDSSKFGFETTIIKDLTCSINKNDLSSKLEQNHIKII